MKTRSPAREHLAQVIADAHAKASDRTQIDGLLQEIRKPVSALQAELDALKRKEQEFAARISAWVQERRANPQKASPAPAPDAHSAAALAALQDKLESAKAAAAPAERELLALLEKQNGEAADDRIRLDTAVSQVLAEEALARRKRAIPLAEELRTLIMEIDSAKSAVVGRHDQFRPESNTHFLHVGNDMPDVQPLLAAPGFYTPAEHRQAVARWASLFTALLTNPDAGTETKTTE